MKTTAKQRIDKVLVALKYAPSRTKAQELLAAGQVFYLGKVVNSPSTLVDASQVEVQLCPNTSLNVGRGADKIRPILAQCGWDCRQKFFADCGASTGGFTQVLLAAGAAQVYAIDVGHGQLHSDLLGDGRVINLEGINLKYPYELATLVDYAVVDLSFISLRLTLKNIFALVRPGPEGEVLALWKPQFEVGRPHIGKNGLVTDREIIEQEKANFTNWCGHNSWSVLQCLPSPITGRQGNQEYFFQLARSKGD